MPHSFDRLVFASGVLGRLEFSQRLVRFKFAMRIQVGCIFSPLDVDVQIFELLIGFQCLEFDLCLNLSPRTWSLIFTALLVLKTQLTA